MKNRNPLGVIALGIITFGIYWLVWFVKTKGEMNRLGANIPTAWFIIVPFVNIWWIWKYAEGVEKVTNEKLSQVLVFLVLFLVDIIGVAIVQDAFNKIPVSDATSPQPTPTPAPAQNTQPPIPPAPTQTI